MARALSFRNHLLDWPYEFTAAELNTKYFYFSGEDANRTTDWAAAAVDLEHRERRSDGRGWWVLRFAIAKRSAASELRKIEGESGRFARDNKVLVMHWKRYLLDSPLLLWDSIGIDQVQRLVDRGRVFEESKEVQEVRLQEEFEFQVECCYRILCKGREGWTKNVCLK